MTRLSWNEAGERYFESGFDRGVLYAAGSPGVPWTGLISVSEDPTLTNDSNRYIDGVKYFRSSGIEEFSGTIKAFNAPEEFLPILGILPVAPGLYVTEQPKRSFDFSYRSFIGNDVDGEEHAYKLHLVYGATVKSNNVDHASIEDDPSPVEYSWDFETVPPNAPGRRPSSHLVLDSRYLPEEFITSVEDILYGNTFEQPAIPSPTSLSEMLQAIFSG